MDMLPFPTVNLAATGRRITQLRAERGLSVKDVQRYLGFEAPQAIYKWQSGQTLPTVDNLVALSWLFKVPMDAILITGLTDYSAISDDEPSGSVFLYAETAKRDRKLPAPRENRARFALLSA